MSLNNNKKRDTWSEAGLDIARELDKAVGGGGIEMIIGSPETGGASYFSNKLPPIIIQEHNLLRKIAVEVSSVEHVERDNQKLLHFLFRKTVER
jgi:hypothetical protein